MGFTFTSIHLTPPPLTLIRSCRQLVNQLRNTVTWMTLSHYSVPHDASLTSALHRKRRQINSFQCWDCTRSGFNVTMCVRTYLHETYIRSLHRLRTNPSTFLSTFKSTIISTNYVVSTSSGNESWIKQLNFV